MTNEWGTPIPGDEMKALKGRIDPETPSLYETYRVNVVLPFKELPLNSFGAQYHLHENHPYYKVRKFNQDNPDKPTLVLHDGSAKVPDDWSGGDVWFFWASEPRDPGVLFTWGGVIAYTPKPKESEVSEDFEAQVAQDKAAFEAKPEAVKNMLRAEADAIKPGNVEPFDKITPERKAELRKEGPLPGSGLSPCGQMPNDEAIEYVRKNFGWHEVSVDEIKRLPDVYKTPLTLARLIQQYEPGRLKPAVDIAAERYSQSVDWVHCDEGREWAQSAFKAGAAWQKENGNGIERDGTW